MQYIIHGDDFGRNSSRTIAIDASLRQGLIQRTTLMMNMPATNEAKELAMAHGYADKVSFHLNLSEGQPLTEGVKQTALCKNGMFRWAHSKTIQSKCMSPRIIAAIRQECEAQMRRFRELGFQSKHLDSHNWILFNLPVWLAVKPLVSQYGFETTRQTCENWIRGKNLPMRCYYRFVARQISRGIRMDGTWAGGLDSLRQAAAAGEIGPTTRAEIMTHPDMAEGVPVDSIHGVHVPMAQLAAAVAEYGAPMGD